VDGSKIGPAKGASALELLIIAGAIAVLVAFASTIADFAKPKSELEQAITITESSVQLARKTARLYKTDVIMRLVVKDHEKQQSIVLSFPKMQKDPVLNEVKEEFVLPPGIQIVIDGEIVHFEPDGEVELPGQILVLSNQAENISHQFVIE
jgi:hypothetical protein